MSKTTTKRKPFRRPDDDDLLRIAQNHATQLSEFFESVQIIATHRDGDGQTAVTHAGKGNYYAREGSVRGWLRYNDAEE